MLKITFILYMDFLLAWSANAIIFIHPDISQCSTFGSSLKCDFNHIQDDVVWGNLPDEGSRTDITIIYIHNARKVIIPRAVCVDVSFYSVQLVHFSITVACQKRMINLRFVDSSANQVPGQLSRLEITRSQVDKVVCDFGLQRMLVTSSQIGEFSAPWPVAGPYEMKFEDSTVEAFKALNIESRVSLYIMNSTFKSMSKESLILGRGSTTTIINSVISFSEDNAIIVKTAAKLTVKGTEGKLSIAGQKPGKETDYNKRPPGVPQMMIPPPVPDSAEDTEPNLSFTQSTCRNGPTWLWFLPTVIATLEAIVIIVLSGKHVPEKRRPSLTPDSESAISAFNAQRSDVPARDNSLNFYSESNMTYPTAFKRR